MKKLLYLLLFIFSHEYLDAQIINKLSVELNLGRYSKEPGLFESEYYSPAFSYLNGFNLGYHFSKKWQYYLGARKLHSTLESAGGYTFESVAVKGVELKIGAKYAPGSHKKLFLSYGLEVFDELSSLEGTYSRDYPPDNDVNHRKNYVGIAPNLGINLKLAERIVFFADTRFRFGRVELAQKGSSKSGNELFHNRAYWSNVYEPLNAFGLRFRL